MSAFVDGLLAGYGIAIPVGAVAILIINLSVRAGLLAGLTAGAGAATADLAYAALAMAAGTAAAGWLAPYNRPLQWASGLILVGLGVVGLWRARTDGSAGPSPAVEPAGLLRIYLQFLAITLVNPMTVVYFAALILGRSPQGSLSPLAPWLFVLGAGLASLSWQSLLAGLGAGLGARLPTRFRLLTTLAGNLIVAGLGVRILLQALSSR
jgi:threonine/homoserine/homoserine lactone efflux protein